MRTAVAALASATSNTRRRAVDFFMHQSLLGGAARPKESHARARRTQRNLFDAKCYFAVSKEKGMLLSSRISFHGGEQQCIQPSAGPVDSFLSWNDWKIATCWQRHSSIHSLCLQRIKRYWSPLTVSSITHRHTRGTANGQPPGLSTRISPPHRPIPPLGQTRRMPSRQASRQ